jgi:hypothetical protein
MLFLLPLLDIFSVISVPSVVKRFLLEETR